MKRRTLSTTVLLAILGAWAIVLRLFDFPILPAAPFLKVDFSDLMVLVGLLVNGPIGAITVALIRDVANYIMKGGESGLPIGVIMSFTASMAMFLPSHFLLKYATNMKPMMRKIWMSLILILGLVISMALLNYYVTLPIYITVMNFPIDNIAAYLLSIIIPFNVIKGILLAAGQFIVVEKLWPIMQQHHIDFPAYQVTNQANRPTI
ncbi:ECF transporter S component [Aerococcaceae bacterium zg-ZJ1578]|uniref:ECF transporter S component n=1 Tax=Aerococcaceae TaxID=186827 RepID=UPI0013BBEC14|nr:MULTISPECIES: ECF transporter S component [unclassified Facklamia]MBK0348856.1 ECF transporter S component [Aerococcaceae bacterium zg-1578]NEW63706.1 ECF transporter S component [Facklamia sp. 252]NEW67177.1 ECF transporter S component [Facklamia sp. 253]QQD66283.1 ECF transporter S component [Aerococcaceae bacterium zg-252]